MPCPGSELCSGDLNAEQVAGGRVVSLAVAGRSVAEDGLISDATGRGSGHGIGGGAEADGWLRPSVPDGIGVDAGTLVVTDTQRYLAQSAEQVSPVMDLLSLPRTSKLHRLGLTVG